MRTGERLSGDVAKDDATAAGAVAAAMARAVRKLRPGRAPEIATRVRIHLSGGRPRRDNVQRRAARIVLAALVLDHDL